jgi:hypothetical protein
MIKMSHLRSIISSVADPDPVLLYLLDQGSGSGMNFFRIPDLGSQIPKPKDMFFLLRYSEESLFKEQEKN